MLFGKKRLSVSGETLCPDVVRTTVTTEYAAPGVLERLRLAGGRGRLQLSRTPAHSKWDLGMQSSSESDPLTPSSDPRENEAVKPPPRGFAATLRQLGPGLIIAGSIVGSGELIATTKAGAQAGISLLWLIIVGCVIKVFAQVELGRYSITHGQTTLDALNTLPGPRARVSWILWYWLIMMLCTIGQLGGIVGGVGQAMAISFPITGDYREAILLPSHAELSQHIQWQAHIAEEAAEFASLSEEEQRRIRVGVEAMNDRLDRLGEQGQTALETVKAGETLADPWTVDDRYWAAAVALLTCVLLYIGRYGLIQNISTVLVVSFTFITVGNVYALQSAPEWSIPLEEWIGGLTPQLPDSGKALGTALATFGIIGVGAAELIFYPYWCMEKGYGRFTGPRSGDDAWTHRARGWMRVMQIDAFVSMIVYTVATLAFFVMGVAVLHRMGLDPDGMRMVSTLAESYVPVFGEYAKWLFLIGAIAVLYSTFLVALASQTRLYTDGLKIWRLISPTDPQVHERWISVFGIVLPLACLTLYWAGLNPVTAVLLSGTMQAIMLPMLGFAALYFRFKRTDPRLAPSRAWDLFLGLSSLGLLIAGGWGAYDQVVNKILPTVQSWLGG